MSFEHEQNTPLEIIRCDTTNEEISGLHVAIDRVLEKVKWHEQKIEEKEKEISSHRHQVEELRNSLRMHVGPLMNQSPTIDSEKSTFQQIIMDCLSKSTHPLNTKQIKDYLVQNRNNTNPSVELSRMVKRGLIERASRGLYQLKGNSKTQ